MNYISHLQKPREMPLCESRRKTFAIVTYTPNKYSHKLAVTFEANNTSLRFSEGKKKVKLPTLFNGKSRDAAFLIYQGKLHKSVCVLSNVHLGLGVLNVSKEKPESMNIWAMLSKG